MRSSIGFGIDVIRRRNGFDDMIRNVKSNSGHIARSWAADCKNDARLRAPVRTGALKESITAERLGPKEWKVEVGKFYGLYVEYGTRHMRAQPFLRPAVKASHKRIKRKYKGVFSGR